MAYRPVPVTLGSPRFHSLDVGGFLVIDARFPPNVTLPMHIHERATMAVMIEGSFDCVFPGRSLDCQAATIHTEPAEAKHGNRMGTAGAHVVVIQPEHRRADQLKPHTGALERIVHQPRSAALGLAWRLSRELHAPDTASPLAVEGLVLELLALLDRQRPQPGRPARPPAWLARARDVIHARFADRLRVADVAREVEVHPVHLARVFRVHHGMSLGAYVRRLRLDWAAVQLATSPESLSAIAARAGFTDQSHFTRAFRVHTGITPLRYRHNARS